MVEYVLLSAFTLTALIFIKNSHYRWTYLFACALFLFFAGAVLALTGQWQRALNFAALLFIILMLFHRLKIHYYKQPFLISDFFLITDWHNWETLLHYKGALLAIAGLLGLVFYAIMGWQSAAPLSGIWQMVGGLVSIIAFTIMWHYSKNADAIKTWLDSLPDDGRDVFLNLPMSCRGLFFKKPKHEGHPDYFLQKAQNIKAYPHASDKATIVVWLQESTLDPINFTLKSYRFPPLSMYQNQPDTLFNAPLRVHTFGGATWKSEFAFLSGLPSTDFGAMSNAVFYSVAPHLKYSLIHNLKAQGYYCVALSPFTKGNYNAKSAYDHFGFDLMLQPQDLGYPAPMGKNLWDIGSDEMAIYAKKILEKQDVPEELANTDKPIFLYVLTMKEHGPYQRDFMDLYHLAENHFSPSLTGGLNDYIHRLVKLNEVIEEFNDYMKKQNNAYIFAYFGDHQVDICGEAVPKRIPYPQPNYITQFTVRGNLVNVPTQQQDFLDLAQAGGLLLEIAGLPCDTFMQANIAMRKLSGGKLEDCADEQLLNSYRSYLYHVLDITK